MKFLFIIIAISAVISTASYSNYSPKEDMQKQLYYYKSDIIKFELKVAEWNKAITELSFRQRDLENQIKILSEIIENINSIDNKNNLIKQEAEFISRNEKLDKLKNEFKNRILWLYKKGSDYQYKILFTSDSPANFYARIQYLNKLTEKRKLDFARIKYEEIAYEESKKIKSYRKSELTRYINKKKEDQTSLLLEKMNIDDSLAVLKSNIENLIYQSDKLKPLIAELDYLLSITNEDNSYELKVVPDYNSESFATLKGQLIFPVNSTQIINDFGKSIDHNTGTIQNNEGIDVSIAENSDIRCIANGTVENILDLPLYRKVIIIKHSDEYRTIYGVVKDIKVSINEKVNAGKIIASTSKNLDGQIFHFEIRKGTMPEDPKYWVARVKQII